MRIAMLYARIRPEERLLVEAFEARNIDHELIDVRSLVYNPEAPGQTQELFSQFDVVFDRCLSLTQATVAMDVLGGLGVRTVNPVETVRICSDKLRTTTVLAAADIPQPHCRVATSEEAALEAVEQMGYPCVIKPTVGSWGRLLAKLNDRDAAEALIEHKITLGSIAHSVVYVQEYVNKPGRDLRVFVVGGKVIAAIQRSAEHWVTNTARGAKAANFEMDSAAIDICERTAQVIGGDIIAVDLLECPERGYLVNEVNHTMEFRNSIDTTGVDIPGKVVEHLVHIAETEDQAQGASA